jgi:CO/xanthine dehydrogenase Mo-binding subunit
VSGYAVVGHSMPRVDALEKVTGQARYAIDLSMLDMLCGRVLRSPHPHARILNIDVSRAKGLAGVKAVITGQDVPPIRYGRRLKDQTTLALDKVCFIGDRVAAVAAISPDIAEEALSLIKVDYEILPALLDPLEAMQSDALLIHEALETYDGFPGHGAGGNICFYNDIRKGDVDQGFREADIVFEDTFTTHVVHQGYMEPHAVVAHFDDSDKAIVWVSTQGVFAFQSALAELLDMPPDRIRVISPHVGGAFGGKGFLVDEPVCVWLARQAGQPVRMAMSREEDFLSTYPRHATIIYLKTGVTRQGLLVAKQARVIFDTGASACFKPGIIPFGYAKVGGPYRIPHVRIEAFCVYTNKIPCGHVRAPGDPQVAFASESQMDIIADRLGMDPLEFRLRNAVEEGDVSPTGEVWRDVACRETLLAVAQQAGWDKRKRERNRGWGLACSQRNTGKGRAEAQLVMDETGAVQLFTGAVDLGTGSSTILAQIAAEEVGLTAGDLTVISADTGRTPYDQGSGASRITYITGMAVKRAAADLRRQLLEQAADRLGVDASHLEIRDGQIRVKGSPEETIPLAEMSGPLVGRGSFSSSTPSSTIAAQITEVEVDPDTGSVEVRRIVAAQDVGFAINPSAVEGQIEGGVAQGVGYALWEAEVFEEGKMINPTFSDYGMPTAMDLPAIETVVMETCPGDGPFGAKAVAEPPTVPTAPAIANAVYDAVGVRIKDLPLTPEKVYRALKEKAASTSVGEIEP